MNTEATHLEFEEIDLDDILRVEDHTESNSEYSVISEDSINYVDIPLDTEVVNSMSPYANEVIGGIIDGSSTSKEMTIYNLKNQLIQA